jgi:two-component system chemotaxis response regulator CheB
VEALTSLVGELPRELPAAVFITLHRNSPESGGNVLANILSTHARLPVMSASEDLPIKPGTICVAGPG